MADKIAFIGAGNMAKSLVGGLLRHGYPATSIVAADPDASQRAGMAALGVSVIRFERHGRSTRRPRSCWP